MRILLSFALFLCVFSAAQAQSASCAVRKFTPVLSPERFVFRDSNRHMIRLVGVGLSNRKIGENFRALAQNVDAQMERLMRDAPWSLAYASPRPNGMGECLAHVQTASGRWVQEEILKAGMAYAITTPSDAYTPSLLQYEGLARTANKGIWRASDSIVRTARTVTNRQYLNSYQIVEGKVRYTRDAGRFKYVCLADDPWQSVCFMVLHTVYNSLRDKGIDLFKIGEEQPIRVRGQLVTREDGLKMYVRNPLDVQLVATAR